MTAEGEHDWSRSQLMVTAELKRLNIATTDLTKEVSALKIELATLTTVVQMKSGVWGALAGLLPALAMLIFYLVGK